MSVPAWIEMDSRKPAREVIVPMLPERASIGARMLPAAVTVPIDPSAWKSPSMLPAMLSMFPMLPPAEIASSFSARPVIWSKTRTLPTLPAARM